MYILLHSFTPQSKRHTVKALNFYKPELEIFDDPQEPDKTLANPQTDEGELELVSYSTNSLNARSLNNLHTIADNTSAHLTICHQQIPIGSMVSSFQEPSSTTMTTCTTDISINTDLNDNLESAVDSNTVCELFSNPYVLHSELFLQVSSQTADNVNGTVCEHLNNPYVLHSELFQQGTTHTADIVNGTGCCNTISAEPSNDTAYVQESNCFEISENIHDLSNIKEPIDNEVKATTSPIVYGYTKLSDLGV